MRKPITKKIRFEVFKRDSFTCQYCGRKAPEIILHIDHITPVSKGGDNNILNLITACFECNSGKSDRTLKDNSVIEKQHSQLEELNERREQLEMLLKWREGLEGLTLTQVDKIKEYLETNMPPWNVSTGFIVTIKRWLKKYPLDMIFLSIDEASTRYLKYDGETVTQASAEDFLDKISGILFFKSLPPLQQKVNWLKVIASKKYYRQGWQFEPSLKAYVKALQDFGWSEEKILDDLQTEVKGLLDKNGSPDGFLDGLEKWTSDINNWER